MRLSRFFLFLLFLLPFFAQASDIKERYSAEWEAVYLQWGKSDEYIEIIKSCPPTDQRLLSLNQLALDHSNKALAHLNNLRNYKRKGGSCLDQGKNPRRGEYKKCSDACIRRINELTDTINQIKWRQHQEETRRGQEEARYKQSQDSAKSQQLFQSSIQKAELGLAEVNKNGFPKQLKDIPAAIISYQAAAKLYEEAAVDCRKALEILQPHPLIQDKQILEKQGIEFGNAAKKCLSEANQWQEKESGQKAYLKQQYQLLSEEAPLFEVKGMARKSLENCNLMAKILQELVEAGETNAQELQALQIRIADLSDKLEAKRLTETVITLTKEEFADREKNRKAEFFNNLSRLSLQPSTNPLLYDFKTQNLIRLPPWQLDALRKPALPSPSKPFDNIRQDFAINIPESKDNLSLSSRELTLHPILDKFVEDMKSDPLAIAQYVFNEIELVDPFHLKQEGVFYPPAIHRKAIGTFLEKQGSPWEQCALLVYLLRKAGYQAVYAEGEPMSLPADFAEKLLFAQFPGENEVKVKYPWVMFLYGNEWIPLFPWMKEIHVEEGYELYGLMPDEYASADCWIKRYLTNDERILQYVGPDGDDTLGVLFERFVDAELRKQGLSLQDVGIKRTLRKRQYDSWKDFAKPFVKGEIKTCASIESRLEIFASTRIEISSKENPKKRIDTGSIYLTDINCGFPYYINVTPKGEFIHSLKLQVPEPRRQEGEAHFVLKGDSNVSYHLDLDLDQTDLTLDVKISYVGNSPEISRNFSIAKGTHAAVCFHVGKVTPQITSYLGEKYSKETIPKNKLQALLSFIGAAYFEKCTRAEKILSSLHKISPRTFFGFGLAKISPDLSRGPLNGEPDLRFPQVDMQYLTYNQSYGSYPFSWHQDNVTANLQLSALVCVDGSANEHQVLREIFNDQYAISTVKLLQIAHERHQKAGLSGPGFVVLTNNSYADAENSPEIAMGTHFQNLAGLDLRSLKTEKSLQWQITGTHLGWKNGSQDIANIDSCFSYAYMTPGLVSSLDGDFIRPPSYTGMGTLIISPRQVLGLISDNKRIMNGGYGSRLPDNISNSIAKNNWELVPSKNSYSFLPAGATQQVFQLADISTKKFVGEVGERKTSLLEEFNKNREKDFHDVLSSFTSLVADVRQTFKSSWDTVADPVDVVSGAFYIDELDLELPGPISLQIRRNYNSQNPLPGLFGCGWKLGFNPLLVEEEDKCYVSEADGTVIVYRYSPETSRWIVLPEDNPDLRNFNSKGIGGTANPFHAYIEKNAGHVFHGTDGSRRIYKDSLLREWIDNVGNFLTFTYEDSRLVRIDSSNGAFVGILYNHRGYISEVYAKDGRRVYYDYDSRGDLCEVKLPNDAVITYDYDRFHRIIRETRPHGRILENIYAGNKVVEQRSPVGIQQTMAASATFNYADNMTKVTDAAGGCTEYRIYQKQIYKIIDPLGYETLQSWFIDKKTWFDAESEALAVWDKPGAWPRSLKSTKDKRGLITEYLYDERGNPQGICMRGEDLTGCGDREVNKYFVYNSLNLCIQEKALDNTTETIFDVKFPYLPERVEQCVGDTLVSSIEYYYNTQGQLHLQNHSGAVTLWEYDRRRFPETMIQKTGTEDPDVVTKCRYNDQGLCVEKITSDGIRRDDYDIAGNKIKSTICDLSGKTLSTAYAGYDLNNQLTWQQNDDPNDTIFLDYNAAGLVKASRKNLSQANGSLIERAGVAYTLFEYDECGRLIEKVDALGNSTYCDYDGLGRLLHTTKDGLTTAFTYEAGGLISSTATPSGATSSCSYTTNGLVKAENYPDGTQLHCNYDLLGRPIQQIKNGMTSTIQYNDAALEQVRTQGGSTEIRRFDARGNVISFTDASGYTWKKTYDALNRLKTEISPDGETKTWNYQGNTIICTLPSGKKSFQRYEAGAVVESKNFAADGTLIAQASNTKYPSKNMTQEVLGDIVMTTWTNTLGLPIRVQQGNKVTTHYYDACGNCVASVDGEGNITHQEFDSSGRLIQKTLPDGATINYEYDADSNLIAYHMPGNLSWKAAYDSMGRKTSEWQESAGKTLQQWKYEYRNGLLSQAKDPLDRLHKYEYDINARLSKESVGDSIREYTYDPRGLLACVIESGKEVSKVERTYDASGRLIREIISLDGTVLQNTQQSWTPSSRTLQVGDHKRDYCYQGGQLKSISSKGFDLSYEYALSGSLVKKSTPFSALEIQYNDAALPQTIDVQLPGNTYRESLQWNQMGKLLSYDSTYPEAHAATYSYTSRGHLKSVQDANYAFDFDKPGRGIRTAAPNVEVLENDVDAFGRIVKEKVDTTVCNTAYDGMGQVVMHGKDQLSWDPWGRMIGITNASYTWKASYDALGRRLQTVYVVHQGTPVVTTSFFDPEEEFQEIGVKIGEKTFWKIYRDNTCDAILDENGDTVSLIHDVLGNLVGIVSDQTILWNKDTPSPYGPRGPPSGDMSELIAFAKAHTWQSLRTDPTGYIWMGARYYDTGSGRFLSPDPVGYPACLDLYNYANGDPINYHDPDGRYASPVTKAIGSTVLGGYDSVKSGYKDYRTGFDSGYSTNFTSADQFGWGNSHSKERPSFGKAIGEMHGRMESTFDPIAKILFPDHPPGMTIGSLPPPSNLGGILGGIASSQRVTFSQMPVQKMGTHSLDLLSKAGQVIDRNGLTKAGRALDKHGNRPNSPFPKAIGNSSSKNYQGQFQLDEILTDPQSSVMIGNKGDVRFYSPDGRGVHFRSDGSFKGFLDYE